MRHCALRTFTRAKVWNLKRAVGVIGSSQLGAKLTDTEEDDIVAFLDALTGQLPNVQYPILPTRTDSTLEPSLVK
jgi:cytochrome c peroxidase